MLAFLGLVFAWLGPFLAVDFLGGFIHWIEDTYFSEDTPIIGRAIIAPNRLHHRDPMAFTSSTLWARNSLLIYAAAAVAGIWWLAGWLTVPWLLAFAMGGLANEIHYWTHCRPRNVPCVVAWLQRLRILQPSRVHANAPRTPGHFQLVH